MTPEQLFNKVTDLDIRGQGSDFIAQVSKTRANKISYWYQLSRAKANRIMYRYAQVIRSKDNKIIYRYVV